MNAASPRIWTTPIVIAVLSTTCLIAALLDDGAWDLVASVILSAVLVYACCKGATVKG
jgi:hypothetical protein